MHRRHATNAAAAPRRFLALPLQPSAALDAWVAALPMSLRPVHPDDRHLTLAFFGRVDDGALRRAWRLLQQHPVPAVTCLTGRPGWFGHPQSPTTLALELPEQGPLQDWVRRRRGALLEAAGAPPDSRPVRLHVSLARLRRGQARPATDDLPPIPTATLCLGPAECWESVSGGAGRRYRTVDMDEPRR